MFVSSFFHLRRDQIALTNLSKTMHISYIIQQWNRLQLSKITQKLPFPQIYYIQTNKKFVCSLVTGINNKGSS